MRDTQSQIPARASGTFDIGGELTVNRLGFGAMRLTGDGVWGEPRDAEECRRVLRRAVELGVNLIDTADAYGPELPEIAVSETIVRVARERDCCAVLGGEHAHGRLGEAFLGVVSRDLIRFARCPVIVIRQGASPPAPRAPLVTARSER